MHLVRYLSLFALCYLGTAATYAQEGYIFQQLDNRSGMSNSAVNCIFQDSDGMLWIGTWDGLNRYDGKDFLIFNYDTYNRFDSKSIGNNVVRHILEDNQHNIWISTVEGVSKYNKNSGAFSNYFYDNNLSTRPTNFGFQVAIQKSGNVFAITNVHGFSRYDREQDIFLPCKLAGKENQIFKILFDGNDRLWAISRTGELFVFEYTSDHVFKLIFEHRLKNDYHLGVYCIGPDIFLGTAGGRIFRVRGEKLNPLQMMNTGQSINDITWYDGKFYVAVGNQGYQRFDNDFNPLPLMKATHTTLERLKVTDWNVDSEDQLWAATDGGGIFKISSNNTPFGNLSVDQADGGSPVRAIGEIGNSIWIGTKGSGIYSIPNFDPHLGIYGEWQHLTAQDELDNPAVYVIKNGHHDIVYIGTDGKGISVYDKRNKQFLKWEDIAGHDKCPDFSSVYSVLEVEDGSVWLGTSGFGLIHLTVYRDNSGLINVSFIEKFTRGLGNEALASNIVYAVCQGEKNDLWIACRHGGLSRLNTRNRTITTYSAFGYEGSLSNNDVLSLYRDKKNRLWIGTSYGLNMIDERDMDVDQPQFKRFNSLSGLPNNTIHAIAEDGFGAIWVSTNKGLAKINPLDLSIIRYPESDGLLSNEFSDGAIWKDNNGYMYFGGIYGLTYFHPQSIRKNRQVPNVALSEQRFGGKAVNGAGYYTLIDGSYVPESYVVKRDENYFQIELRALSLANAKKCEYAWKLDGHDKEWQYGGTNGRISYSSLLPGTYPLLVKWSNGDGVWSQERVAFKFQVREYPWLTWPALFLYLLLFLFGTHLFYRYRKNKTEIQHQLRLEQELRKKDEMLHKERLDFFTNITHELQTPLTLIMGTAERFKHYDEQKLAPKKRADLLTILYQQASRLTYLVQQLLEFRKAEAGHLTPQYALHDLSLLLIRLADLFIPMSEQMRITYERKIPPGIIGNIDCDKLEKIIFNLLSNAFKHTNKNERISVSLTVDQSHDKFIISVSNSGSELRNEDVAAIFSKFKTLGTNPSNQFSTGVGLAFTSQLVTLLNGRIDVTVDNEWVTFCVELPFIRNHHTNASLHEEHISNGLSFLYQTIVDSENKRHSLADESSNKYSLIESLDHPNQKVILIVDDESAIRYLLKDILKESYLVYEAEDGIEAIDIIRNHPPDLIISDVMMPRMDGLALCSKIKNTPSTCHIPFVLLSAKGTIEQQTEGYEVGADAYVAKPFHSDHIRIRIKNIFEQQERIQQLFKQVDEEIPAVIGHQDQQKFLRDLVYAIETNIDNPELNATVIEKALSLSKMQLYRKLKIMSGMSPSEFIRHIRLKHAARLLLETQLTVSEIFYRTGFNSQSYFFREFKKQYNCAPNEYRTLQQV